MITARALEIAQKWVGRIGGGFHPDTRGNDYDPPFPPDVVADYEADMGMLFAEDCCPYEAALTAIETLDPFICRHCGQELPVGQHIPDCPACGRNN